MTPPKIKHLFLAGVAFVALSGVVVGWGYSISSTQAADDHGDGHAHQDAEAQHDTGKTEQHGHGHEDGHGHDEGGSEGGGDHDGDENTEGLVPLSAAQIAAAGIKVEAVASGELAREVKVPGKIVAAADRMAQIVPKVSGTVTEARKNLGDRVEAGDVLALIESREMAEAVAEHLASSRAEELSRTTYTREKALWDKKITAEQDYLTAKNSHQEAKIRSDLSKQKLQALGHNGDVSANGNSRFYELRSPISGRVISRELTLGEYVDTTHSAFTVADLSVVWVETAIAPNDLPFVKEGLVTNVTGSGGKSEGTLIFVSPAIDPETRAAKAIIELDNADGTWRPGEFANAAIATSAQKAELSLPKEAVQSMNGMPVVFVQTEKGFIKRDVTLGREDSRHVEILSGVKAGESVAISNTFTLKAELGKSEAGHEH